MSIVVDSMMYLLAMLDTSPMTCADFPKDSFVHAGCHMTADFTQFTCTELEPLISAEIQSWATGDSCSASGYPGFYTLKLETEG